MKSFKNPRRFCFILEEIIEPLEFIGVGSDVKTKEGRPTNRLLQ